MEMEMVLLVFWGWDLDCDYKPSLLSLSLPSFPRTHTPLLFGLSLSPSLPLCLSASLSLYQTKTLLFFLVSTESDFTSIGAG